MTIVTRSAEETVAAGRRLGRLLRGLDVVCLYGTLGAGKTTFTKGLARGAGCRGRVMSPTFGLARSYRGRRWTVHHLDLYRVAEGQTGDIGIEEFVRDPGAICAIEWPEAGLVYLPPDRLEIRFSTRRDGSRRIALKGRGPRSRRLARGLL